MGIDGRTVSPDFEDEPGCERRTKRRSTTFPSAEVPAVPDAAARHYPRGIRIPGVEARRAAVVARRYGRGAVYVTDLRHFLDLPETAPGPARSLADHLSSVVRAATAGDPGVPWVSALPCRRRPGRRACPGFIEVLRTDIPASIHWQCVSCGDEGVISGWEGSPFDLRTSGIDGRPGEAIRAVVSSEVAATLRSLVLVDSAGERMIFTARVVDGSVVLHGDLDDLDELIGYVAAEANHERNRRRQKRLDAAFDALREVIEEQAR